MSLAGCPQTPAVVPVPVPNLVPGVRDGIPGISTGCPLATHRTLTAGWTGRRKATDVATSSARYHVTSRGTGRDSRGQGIRW